MTFMCREIDDRPVRSVLGLLIELCRLSVSRSGALGVMCVRVSVVRGLGRMQL